MTAMVGLDGKQTYLAHDDCWIVLSDEEGECVLVVVIGGRSRRLDVLQLLSVSERKGKVVNKSF